MSEEKKQYPVYAGDEPYGFVSYAHTDAARVLPVIAALHRDRLRLWYDGGIEAGTNWPEEVASHLKRAGTVVFFLSAAFLRSQNCIREVHYAVAQRKPMIAVYLEAVELPGDLAMQFSPAAVIREATEPEAVAAETEKLLGPSFLGDGVTGYETVCTKKRQGNLWRALSLVFFVLFLTTVLLAAGYLRGWFPTLGARTVTVDQAPGGAAEAGPVEITAFQDSFSRDVLLKAYGGTSLYLCGNTLVSDPAAIRREDGGWTVAGTLVEPGSPDVLAPVAEKEDLTYLALVDQGIESFDGLTACKNLVYLDISGNPVRDLSFLSAFPALRTVKLMGVDAADYAVLAALPALEAVYVDEGALSPVLDALEGTDADVIVKPWGDR